MKGRASAVPLTLTIPWKGQGEGSLQGEQCMLCAAASGSRTVAGEPGPRQAVGVMDQFHLVAL
jgi:hypothetical protein